jgi:ribosomal protein S18 acetylase RimI-like enzyme
VQLIETLAPEALIVHVDRLERRGRLLGALQAGDNVAFIAESGRALVGELALTRASGMLGLGVRSGWRRRGVGTALVRAAEEWARTNDLRRLAALVREENNSGLAFLRGLGFREERRFDDDAGDGLVALGRTL